MSVKSVIDAAFGNGAYDAIATESERKAVYNRLLGIKNNTNGTAKKKTNTNNSQAYTVLGSELADGNIKSTEYVEQMFTSALENLKNILNGQDKLAHQSYDYGLDVLNKNTDKALAEAYISKQQAARNLPQQLAANGISGGGAESTIMNLENNYANNRNSLQAKRTNSIAELLNKLNTQKAQNAQGYFSAVGTAQNNKFNNLLALQKAYSQQLTALKKAAAKG